MQTKNGIEYYSLYEYLGYAAGMELGGKVRNAAKRKNQPTVTQYVEQGDYKGNVFCYTEEFLDKYFNKQMEENFSPEPDEFDDLPF